MNLADVSTSSALIDLVGNVKFMVSNNNLI